ncbi:MAG: helix-turn-helix transcriptional regulator [Dehalococcoidales bacterium]|nr:helix-turn-helix transcriptional regulator [Dehalococcoidales bacterium]
MERTNGNNDLGKILKQRRVMIPLTLRRLATVSGISSSHLGRIEKGERFPSASVLRRIAEPLGFEENELFCLAGYMSYRPADGIGEARYSEGQLDPYVSKVLSEEPFEVQRAIVGILVVLKNIAKALKGAGR